MKKTKLQPLYTVTFIILLIYVLSMLFPILWAIFTALKSQEEFRINPLGLPQGAIWNWKWSNFSDVASLISATITTSTGRYKVGLGTMLYNSLLYAIGCALIQTLVPCVVAYLTAKFPYKFSAFINGLVLALMATPILGSQAAEIQLLKSINLYNTMWGMYILKFNFLGLYYLIFYEAFKSLPNDFLESAYIDGASEMRVLISIALPMVKTLIGTVFLLKFIAFWNDYETIIMYLKSYPTLANGIYNLGIESQGAGAVVPMKMAGCMFLVIPIVVIFLIFSKRLMGNLSMGGLKE